MCQQTMTNFPNMTISILFVVLFASIATSINVLDSSNLRSSLLEHPMSLVMFEASWSPQSQEGKPILEKLATERKDLFVGSLDCETRETNDICNEENIRAYPTVRLYRKEKEYVEFTDDITSDKILKFVSDPDAYPKVTDGDLKEKEEIPDPDIGLELDAIRVDLNQLPELIKAEKKLIIFYYANWCPRSKGTIPLIKQYLPVLKEKGLKLATCDCEINSHRELCRDKMTHLPHFDVYVDGKQTFDSETFFSEIMDWNQENFERMLDKLIDRQGDRERQKDVGEGQDEEEEDDPGAEEESDVKGTTPPKRDEL